jgi:hypothetical protein
LTNNHDAAKVINTSLEVMRHFLLNKNKKASFGFSGAASLEENENLETKRFRIYRKIMENLFSPTNFFHYQLPERNIYLLVNRLNSDPKLLIETLTEILRQHYVF